MFHSINELGILKVTYPFRNEIVSTPQISEGLFRIEAVLHPVDFYIYSTLGNSNINGLVSIMLLELCWDTIFS
ncbi:MAG: hypothetical protein Q8941_22090 [Bacteroidota bacterium]|nr:hypothetical protein [Bacteroidota bacterium]